MDSTSFFEKLLPYAQDVQRETPWKQPVSVTLAQWSVESGNESKTWVGGNNYAGIRRNGKFMDYPSISEFVKDYIKVLNLDYYKDVRDVSAAGQPAENVALALAESKWDAGNYKGKEENPVGFNLLSRLNDTLKYDNVPLTSPGLFPAFKPDDPYFDNEETVTGRVFGDGYGNSVTRIPGDSYNPGESLPDILPDMFGVTKIVLYVVILLVIVFSLFMVFRPEGLTAENLGKIAAKV